MLKAVYRHSDNFGMMCIYLINILRDLDQMCKATGASPIFVDATNEFDVPEGPVGGQTRISLRNEHLSYVITWYSLCAFTSFMWYNKFLKGK